MAYGVYSVHDVCVRFFFVLAVVEDDERVENTPVGGVFRVDTDSFCFYAEYVPDFSDLEQVTFPVDTYYCGSLQGGL